MAVCSNIGHGNPITNFAEPPKLGSGVREEVRFAAVYPRSDAGWRYAYACGPRMVANDRPYFVSKEPDGLVKLLDHTIQFGGITFDEPNIDMPSGRIVKMTLKMEDVTDNFVKFEEEDMDHSRVRAALQKLSNTELNILGLTEQAVEGRLMNGVSSAPIIAALDRDQTTLDEWFDSLLKTR